MTDLPVLQNRKNLEWRTTQFLFDLKFCRYWSSDLTAPECISTSHSHLPPSTSPISTSEIPDCKDHSISTALHTSHRCFATPISGWIQGILGEEAWGITYPWEFDRTCLPNISQPAIKASTSNPMASASATFLSSLHNEQLLALLSL